MNTVILNLVEKDIKNFVLNATVEDCSLVLPKGYSKGFYDYIEKLRQSLSLNNENAQKPKFPIKFLAQFPEQATALPAVSFALGNISTGLELQTESYETEELTNKEYEKFLHLSSTFEGGSVKSIQAKSYISTTQVVAVVFGNNKLEVCWLMYLIDFIIHFRREELAVAGIYDVNTQETDLRLRQELFPLAVPTRILTINFKYETVIPLVEKTRFPMNPKATNTILTEE